MLHPLPVQERGYESYDVGKKCGQGGIQSFEKVSGDLLLQLKGNGRLRLTLSSNGEDHVSIEKPSIELCVSSWQHTMAPVQMLLPQIPTNTMLDVDQDGDVWFSINELPTSTTTSKLETDKQDTKETGMSDNEKHSENSVTSKSVNDSNVGTEGGSAVEEEASVTPAKKTHRRNNSDYVYVSGRESDSEGTDECDSIRVRKDDTNHTGELENTTSQLPSTCNAEYHSDIYTTCLPDVCNDLEAQTKTIGHNTKSQQSSCNHADNTSNKLLATSHNVVSYDWPANIPTYGVDSNKDNRCESLEDNTGVTRQCVTDNEYGQPSSDCHKPDNTTSCGCNSNGHHKNSDQSTKKDEQRMCLKNNAQTIDECLKKIDKPGASDHLVSLKDAIQCSYTFLLDTLDLLDLCDHLYERSVIDIVFYESVFQMLLGGKHTRNATRQVLLYLSHRHVSKDKMIDALYGSAQYQLIPRFFPGEKL